MNSIKYGISLVNTWYGCRGYHFFLPHTFAIVSVGLIHICFEFDRLYLPSFSNINSHFPDFHIPKYFALFQLTLNIPQIWDASIPFSLRIFDNVCVVLFLNFPVLSSVFPVFFSILSRLLSWLVSRVSWLLSQSDEGFSPKLLFHFTIILL